MQVQLIAIVVTMFALTACSAGGGDTAPKPGAANNASGSTSPVPPVTPEPCVPSAANNNCQPTASIVDQCWAEMFDTAAAKACATAGKMYNRVLKKCVDAGVTLKTGCTAADVPATALAKALADMSALHPDSNPQLDQCGTYTADSKTYNVYYFMGKKYTGAADGRGTYEGYFSKLCYKPGASDPVCPNADLALSTPTPVGSLKCGDAAIPPGTVPVVPGTTPGTVPVPGTLPTSLP